MDEARIIVECPLGPLAIHATERGLTRVSFDAHGDRARGPAQAERIAAHASGELEAYFRGELRAFGLPLAPDGTEFQRRAWARLERIAFARTASYEQVARDLGSVARAVGQANAANPIAIIIPCHRVVRAGGALGGYAGGLDRKRWLLDHERAAAGETLF